MREQKLEESAEERKLNHVNLVSLFLFLLGTKNTEGCWHSAHMCPPLPQSPMSFTLVEFPSVGTQGGQCSPQQ